MGETVLAQEVGTGNVLVMIAYLVLIIFGAWILTKVVCKRMVSRRSGAKKAKQTKSGRMITVLDRIGIDRDKTLIAVRFEGKDYLLSSSAQGVHCIDKAEAQPEEEQQPQEQQAQDAPTAAQKDDVSFGKRFAASFKTVLAQYGTNGKNTRGGSGV